VKYLVRLATSLIFCTRRFQVKYLGYHETRLNLGLCKTIQVERLLPRVFNKMSYGLSGEMTRVSCDTTPLNAGQGGFGFR